MTTAGSRIKECRLRAGLTQEELAKKLDLQKSAIAKYENGRVENIKRSTILKLSEVLNENPCYLMGWDSVSSASDSDNPFLDSVDPQEQYLVTAYRSFNDDGRDKLVRYAHDLDDTGKYARDRKPDKTKEEAEAAYIKSRSESAQKPDASASNTIGEGKSETA